MAKKLLLAFAAMTALSIFAPAATRPNFNGTWNMARCTAGTAARERQKDGELDAGRSWSTRYGHNDRANAER